MPGMGAIWGIAGQLLCRRPLGEPSTRAISRKGRNSNWNSDHTQLRCLRGWRMELRTNSCARVRRIFAGKPRGDSRGDERTNTLRTASERNDAMSRQSLSTALVAAAVLRRASDFALKVAPAASLLLPLLGAVALSTVGAPTGAWATDYKPAACVDNTPHKVRMVKVAPGVELEVLDWGGSGKAMVLLPGGGVNAHVYDRFAFQFTDYFHVIGITRRGFLPSSQPRNGYDVPTRAADDIAVLDALGIGKAAFAGHSLSGSELSELGLTYGARVDKLVYLDAADLSERFLPSRREPPGAQPLFTAATLKSLWAYQAASARYTALREPDQSVCLNLEFGDNGAIMDSTSPQFVTDKL